MVRLEIYQEDERRHLLDLPCPTYDQTPFVTSVTSTHARVAVISTAGLHLRSDRPFGIGESEYRVIPKQVDPKDLVMSHVSTNFDRTGFQMDVNMVIPLDRLEELAAQGVIDSVAEFHYSFMGATDPTAMESEARKLASLLKGDQVNSLLLVPV
ncbi:MAG: selenoprotein B glycine/betaine/sarcosine/D-proline reductase [Desulfobulbaceae bacterium]|nr:MAG: selenoprotein B glycine/betaine/sarcosine/D-proline reductase [Desulfobulbaceae bacterium]